MRAGILHTISGNKTKALDTDTSGTYFFYIDAVDGTLSYSAVSWTLLDTKVPVAIVIYGKTTTPSYMIADERHTCLIDRRVHWYEHMTAGTKWVSGGVLADYSVAQASPTDAQNTFSISEALIADEDMRHTLAELTNPSGTGTDYLVVYRTGASTWTWETSAVPFRYTANGYIQYDSSGTMTEGAQSKAYNTYLAFTNITGQPRFIIIHGRAQFANAAAAYAEDIRNFSLAGLPFAEMVIVYQLTWETGNAYNTKGKCRLARIPQRINTSVTAVNNPAQSSDHNGLLNLQGGTTGEYYHLTQAAHTLINGSQTAKCFFAAPNAGDGVPVFRAIVASDVPTLNQDTTGSAAKLTTPRAINGVDFDGSAAITVPSNIAPGTSGNLMVSNGTVWTSAANPSEPAFTNLPYAKLPNAGTRTWATGGDLSITGGNVGIGCAPSYLLDCQSASYPTFHLKDTTTGLRGYMMSHTATPALWLGAITNHTLHLVTNDTPRITVLGGGNVGIGCTPNRIMEITATRNSTDYSDDYLRLTGKNTVGAYFNTVGIDFHIIDVGNSGEFSAAYIKCGCAYVVDGAHSLGNLQFYTKDSGVNSAIPTIKMLIDHTGCVGIGTTSPNHPLVVGPAPTATQGWCQIAASNATSAGVAAACGDRWTYLYTSATECKLDAYNMATNAALNIKLCGNGGRVGICMDAASSRLDIQGSANEWTQILYGSATAGQSYGLHIRAGTGYASEQALGVYNYNATITHFQVFGDGAVNITNTNSNVTGRCCIGSLNWNATSSAANVTVNATDGMLFRYTSSRRYKENIIDLADKSDLMLKARPVSFTCKNTGNRNIGFIAEEFHDLGLNELVTYLDGLPEAISYDWIACYLLQIVKKQDKRIKALEEKAA
jgi:hypothetical protein